MSCWISVQGPARKIFVEFLERSCTAEFSGFLLYKELGRRLKKTNPVVAEVIGPHALSSQPTVLRNWPHPGMLIQGACGRPLMFGPRSATCRVTCHRSVPDAVTAWICAFWLPSQVSWVWHGGHSCQRTASALGRSSVNP